MIKIEEMLLLEKAAKLNCIYYLEMGEFSYTKFCDKGSVKRAFVCWLGHG